ncbi:MAG TPA: sigma-70 family RNA polymerase sigma factor [Thermoanaerobaculia bacterium]|nr:sigma-70 family RNA polymerase sigma factor [Thermoanaerobaculia bacterium]
MTTRVLSAALEAPSADQLERDLVARHRQGDPEAFDEYYRRYSGLIYNLTLRQSGDPELAQDLSQEVLLRVYRSLGRFGGRSTLKTWTYRVCINLCRSRLGRKRLPTLSLEREDGSVREVPDDQPGPEARAISSDERRLLSEALPLVDLPFREAVVLRDLEDLSYQEIADVLRVPIGTVRSRIARGREQLRRLVAGEEESP